MPSVLKVLVVGNTTSGKTSIIYELLQDNHPVLMSVFPSKDYKEITSSKGTRVVLQIWDLPGAERFRSKFQNYYRKAQIVLVVYDITVRDTFIAAETYWIPTMKEVLGDAGSKYLYNK